MKTIIFSKASVILLTAISFIALLFYGCSKDDSDTPSKNEIVGIWKTQIMGDLEGDVLYLTMEIQEDSRMTVITEYPKDADEPDDDEESDEEDLISVTEMYWKIQGDKILFAYVDGDEDGVPDDEEDLIWEVYTYKLTGSTLALTDEWEMNNWKYIKL